MSYSRKVLTILPSFELLVTYGIMHPVLHQKLLKCKNSSKNFVITELKYYQYCVQSKSKRGVPNCKEAFLDISRDI